MSKQKILILAAFIALQSAALLIYKQVTARRTAHGSGAAAHRSPPRPEAIAIKSFEVTMQDGSAIDLTRLKEPTLVHFWATWCAPCKTELPGLIAWSHERAMPILIVSLDSREVALGPWTKGARPETLARAEPAGINGVFHSSTLPVTLLIEPRGRVTARAQGARDWKDEGFQASWQPLIQSN